MPSKHKTKITPSKVDSKAAENSEIDHMSTLDEKPRSIILALLSQLKFGMDLHRVALPTFILEPRSMLERITDFFTYQSQILEIPKQEDPLERMINVCRYFISGSDMPSDARQEA